MKILPKNKMVIQDKMVNDGIEAIEVTVIIGEITDRTRSDEIIRIMAMPENHFKNRDAITIEIMEIQTTIIDETILETLATSEVMKEEKIVLKELVPIVIEEITIT